MWITNHKRYIDPETFVIFYNRVNDNIASFGTLTYVKVNFAVIIR